MFNKENIPKGALFVMEKLEENGYEAYLVGGCVRDMLMGLEPKDWDICTNAHPEVVQAMFESTNTVIPTGIKHGTVTIMVYGEGFEVTTYRIDGEYSDGRRPDTIQYAKSLEEDLSRRDFTVNALAFNLKSGIMDFYGGFDDIDRGLLCCVGKPEDRFNEDSLRILRALRFASTKGFRLEDRTDKAIRSMYKQMSVLSAERILSELSKLLQGDGAFQVLMDYSEVFAFLMPELSTMLYCGQHNPHHMYNVWEHTCKVVADVPKDEVIRFAAFLHDAGKPETRTTVDGVDHFYGHAGLSAAKANSILRRMKSSNDLIDKVTTLIEYHDAELPNKASIKRLLNKIGVDMFKQLLQLKEADAMAQSSFDRGRKIMYIRFAEKVLIEIEAENACFTLKDLAVNGKDLIEIGCKPGKELGQTLDILLSGVIDEFFPNDRDVLLEQALEVSKK